MSEDRDEAERAAPEPGKEEVPSKKAALAVQEGGYIVPSNIEEAYRMAVAIVGGRLAPDSYNNDPQKVMLGLMAAMEAGLPPLAGLRNIAIINGRPAMWGDSLMALVQSKNLITDYNEEQVGAHPNSNDLSVWPDEFGVRVTIKRRGQEGAYVGEFTVGDAKRAKLWLNARRVPWIEYPLVMLKHRARAFALRTGFADALMGIAIREEIEDTFDAAEDRKVEIDLEAAPVVEAPPLPEESADASA